VIRAGCVDGKPGLESSVRGIAVYLDTFAIKSLAKGDASLRQRFTAALYGGADLLFSIANAVEISGFQGASSRAVKAFLDDLGPNWYPIEMSPDDVMKREAAGLPPGKCCLADELLHAFFRNRTHEHVPGSGRVIDLSEGFFQLGQFVDWLAPQRDHFLTQRKVFDNMLVEKVPLLRAKHKQNPGWLDRAVFQPQFHPSRAATFAYQGFMRDLICDRGYQVRSGDGMDFCHAVMATAFASFATLDKQWKRRVENLPKPNRVPRIYYEPELQAMIVDIESGIKQLNMRGGS
jgi:hypothetical protein